MKKSLISLICALTILGLFLTGVAWGKKKVNLTERDKDLVVIETSLGKIVIALFPNAAPKHCQQIKTLVKEGFYDGTLFHRVIPDFVIQGGDPLTKTPNKNLWGSGSSKLPNIPAEFNALSHTKGRVAAARAQDVNSANCQFYICVGNPTFLDGKYTVFGEVVEGMPVAEEISKVPRDGMDRPLKNIVMKKVYLSPAK